MEKFVKGSFPEEPIFHAGRGIHGASKKAGFSLSLILELSQKLLVKYPQTLWKYLNKKPSSEVFLKLWIKLCQS